MRRSGCDASVAPTLNAGLSLVLKVYEEKQRRCEREMEELRQSCASKMKQASQKAQRAQQVLQLQVRSIFQHISR